MTIDKNTEETREMVARFRANPDFRVLERLVPQKHYGAKRATARGIVVDVETTGLLDGDKIIQLAILPFSYDPETGEVGEVGEIYIGFEDPGQALSDDIVNITGITDEQLKGQKLDDEAIGAIVGGANIVIAHQASFDRPFLDRRLAVFQNKPWACSLSDVNWKDHGIKTRGLESLMQAAHGCFYDAHRADVDCQATLDLLARPLPDGGRPLAELLARARESDVLIWAFDSPFLKKEMLKERGYKWFRGAENIKKCWRKTCSTENLAEEVAWLDNEVYDRKRPGKIRVSQLTRKTAFSERVGPEISTKPYLKEAEVVPEVVKVPEQRSLGL